MGETERGLQERGLPKAGRAAPRAARPSVRLGHVLLAGREEDAGTGGGKESTATGSLHSDPEGPAVVTKKPSGSEHRRRAEPGASIRVRRCRDHGRGAVEALGGPWEQGGASCGCRAGERALQPPPVAAEHRAVLAAEMGLAHQGEMPEDRGTTGSLSSRPVGNGGPSPEGLHLRPGHVGVPGEGSASLGSSTAGSGGLASSRVLGPARH